MKIALLMFAASLAATSAAAQDADRSVDGGGIKVEGWKGRVDRRPASQGKTIADSKFGGAPGALRLSVGPAGIYWNPTNTATGDYQVKATFKEHKMGATHPHSYGIFIGGADLESDTETLLYCIAYGNGTYSIKTFHGANVVTVVDRAGHEALRKAEAPIRKFMLAQTRESDLTLFVNLSKEPRPNTVDDVPTYVVIPAFLISELKTAFLMGFIIFVPFLVIDIVVSSALLAMGMMMLPPVVVSLPFKILLFVLVDGWGLIIGSLVSSFVT